MWIKNALNWDECCLFLQSHNSTFGRSISYMPIDIQHFRPRFFFLIDLHVKKMCMCKNLRNTAIFNRLRWLTSRKATSLNNLLDKLEKKFTTLNLLFTYSFKYFKLEFKWSLLYRDNSYNLFTPSYHSRAGVIAYHSKKFCAGFENTF